MILYKITFLETNKFYIGITSNIKLRYNTHKYSVSIEKNTPLYNCMRKYPMWSISEVEEYNTRKEAVEAEIFAIAVCRLAKRPLLNLADGGEGGFVITDVESWKVKIKEKRAGRTPALGMKHTEDNKKKFSVFSKQRWDIYGRYPQEVVTLSFKDAKKRFGISKTHYYRLLKRTKNNELS